MSRGDLVVLIRLVSFALTDAPAAQAQHVEVMVGQAISLHEHDAPREPAERALRLVMVVPQLAEVQVGAHVGGSAPADLLGDLLSLHVLVLAQEDVDDGGARVRAVPVTRLGRVP